MANTTWNPSDKTNCTLTGGNLIATTAAGGGGVRGINAKTAGKYYIELTYTTLNTNSISSGLALATASLTSPGVGAANVIRLTGNISVNGSATGFNLGLIAASAVIGIAVDFGSQLIWFRIAPSGNWNGNGTANPATGVNGASISTITGSFFPLMAGSTSDKVTANFGDIAFSGAVPSGFVAGWPVSTAINGPIVTMIG